MELRLSVNGREHHLDVEPGTTLLAVLRDHLELTGTKEGCAEGECGACTVLLDGRPVDSCIFMAHAADGRAVTTIEGITAPGADLSPLQAAMARLGAVQCGFCTPGFVVTLTALLRESPRPDADEVRQALAGNLCRCTGYGQLVAAALEATGVAP